MLGFNKKNSEGNQLEIWPKNLKEDEAKTIETTTPKLTPVVKIWKTEKSNTSEKRKYEYLEDVPNWEEKLKMYKVSRYYVDTVSRKDGELNFNYPDSAEAKTREINETFGVTSAKYKSFKDTFGRTYYHVYIEDRADSSDFGDILDAKGNLLPKKDNVN